MAEEHEAINGIAIDEIEPDPILTGQDDVDDDEEDNDEPESDEDARGEL